ncbi:Homeobox protein MSH-B [Trichuris trichiura]|uniref:Homeobox protein MSH-B n=1 Tax=Trichuris trichiura TaxID=36087 RepID=A0A077ZDF6_TRITR|nr:Homeobox protein MSH-B [Trichuris trichiura]
MGERTTENDVSCFERSIENHPAKNLIALKTHLLCVDKSIREATATAEIIKVLRKELEQKDKQIAFLEEKLLVLKHAEQKNQKDAADLRPFALEQSAQIAQASDKIVQLQMSEQRWRTISEHYKEIMDSQRLETVELRTKYETLLRNEASLQAKYEMLEAQLIEYKSNSRIKNADHQMARPDGKEFWHQAVTCIKNEAASLGKNFLPLKAAEKSSTDKSSLSSVRQEHPGGAVVEHVNIRREETPKRPDNFRTNKSEPDIAETITKNGKDQLHSNELESARKRLNSVAAMIVKKARVEMALPPFLPPIGQQVKRKSLPSEQAKKIGNPEPKENIRIGCLMQILPPSDKAKISANVSSVQAETSSKKKKEKKNVGLKQCCIPPKFDKTKTSDIPASVRNSLAVRSSVQLIPIESVGKRGKWLKDSAFHEKQAPVGKLVNGYDGSQPLGPNANILATEALATVSAIGTAHLHTNAICNLEKRRPFNKDVDIIRSEKTIEQKDASHSDLIDMDARLIICFDDTVENAAQQRNNNAETFDGVIKFPGSFPLIDHCQMPLPSSIVPVVGSVTVERYLLSLFETSAFLTPALACKRLHSLGKALTPQTLTNSIITVLLSRGFHTANLCRMARVVQFEPIRVKGERCIVALLEQLFNLRPLAWRSAVKNLLVKQLLLRLRHIHDSLTATQMETLCRFYVLFAEMIKSTSAVCHLIEGAAMLAVEEEVELAMSVLISWPKIFKEIACDTKKEQPFARIVLALLVKSTKAVPQSVMERLIFKFCGEKIEVPMLEYQQLFTNLSDCLLSSGKVEFSTVTGDVRLTKKWARKLCMLETLFKLSNELNVVSAVRDNFYTNIITWPGKSSQLSISDNRFRSFLVSLIALAQLADPTTAFCQLNLDRIVRKLEDILEGKGMYSENTVLRSCCAQLLVRLLPWYPKSCYRILKKECSAATADAQWRRLFEMAKHVYVDGIMPK